MMDPGVQAALDSLAARVVALETHRQRMEGDLGTLAGQYQTQSALIQNQTAMLTTQRDQHAKLEQLFTDTKDGFQRQHDDMKTLFDATRDAFSKTETLVTSTNLRVDALETGRV